MFKSTCEIAIHNFPFDEQRCELKFGSWTYDESKINLTALNNVAQTDAFKENGEWDLIEVISFRESIKYDCCAEKYPFVKFIIYIKRRTLYFIFNLIFPCVLISMMTFLGFALPPE
jgi:nicotinic acetylcholine receptor, invertebrate